jgi:hypothetical protein
MKAVGFRLWHARGSRVLVTTTVAVLATLASAASALAHSYQNEFTAFAHCPVASPGVVLCLSSQVSGGEFKMGSTTVPIAKTVTLQGGLRHAEPELVAPTDGTPLLSKTTLTVPGGLVGLEGLGGEVTATAETAGPVDLNLSALFGAGTLVELPAKVKLDNPVLGEECYIGTNAEPVKLNLTDGTTAPPPPNTPISGNSGHNSPKAAGAITLVTDNILVDNAFAAPGVTGCGLVPAVFDLAVDTKAGLPSAAGHNTAIMEGQLEEAEARTVKTEQELPQFGRCVKAFVKEGKTTTYKGRFTNANCTQETAESPEPGKYEWSPGPGPKAKFSGTLARVTFETLARNKVSCPAGASSGEYTGLKTENVTLTLTGCENSASHAACNSPGAAGGEIRSALTGTLGFVNDSQWEKPLVGLALAPRSGSLLASIECAGTEQLVEGGLIANLTAPDKMALASTLKAKAVAGKQTPQSFEEVAADAPSTTIVSGPTHTTEGSGITASVPQHAEEAIEIKAEAF